MLRSLTVLAVFVVALFVATAAMADSAQGRDCWCRYSGKAYLEGSCICMRTPAGLRRACCGRVLNNSSWSFTSTGCVTSDRGTEPAAGIEKSEVVKDLKKSVGLQ